MKPITITAHGTPQPQGSKNAYQRGRKTVLVETSKQLPKWRQTIINAAQQTHHGPPIDTPITITVEFRMPRPKRPKYPVPAVKPDLDKLLRAVGDALEQSGLITNDSRITTWHATKKYSDTPGATITIEGAA